MQPLSEVILSTKATAEMVDSFIRYLMTLTPTELTTFYCEDCHGQLETDLINRPGNPFHETNGTCSRCDRFEDVSNPAINRFLNEKELSLEHDSGLITRFGDNNDQLIRILQNWLTPTDYSSVTYMSRTSNQTPAEAWVMYGRKKVKQVYKTSSIGVVYKVMLLAFFPDCYSIERFNANPISGKADQEVDDEEVTLSEPELPTKFTSRKGWFSRLWAFFQ